MLQTIIAVAVLILILFFAVRYIYKEKKKGAKCIGCPFSDCCKGNGSHYTKTDLQ